MEPSAPATVAKVITATLAGLADLRLRWVRVRRGQPPPPRARITGRPRLTIVYSGERRVLATVDGVAAEHRLLPGDVLVVAAEGWSIPLPGARNQIIAINCHDGGTAFEVGDLTFHSGGPLNPAARTLLDALSLLGGDPSQRHLGAAVLRATVAAALADCRLWPEADRARIAWSRAKAAVTERLDHGREAMAQAAGVHPNHLSRLCRRLEGISLMSWLTTRRMERARQLLATGMAHEAVARACGYAEPSHFRRTFRREHGIPPRAWTVAEAGAAATLPA